MVDEKGSAVLLSLQEALWQAKEQDLDLVEISPHADPPVCKIINYGKYAYQQQKKKKQNKKSQHVMHLKNIKMRPKTDVHDYNFKVRHVKEFIESGDRVKITIKFRGREMSFLKMGHDQLDKVVEDTKDIAKIESRPKMEGRNMIMVLVPNKKG